MINVDKIFDEYTKGAYEGVLYGDIKDEKFNIQYGIDLDKKIAIGGVTKLFTVSCILRLIENKKLIFDSKLPTFLSSDECKGLCNYKGTDYSESITLRDLLFQTSGLPDYYNFAVKPQIARGDVKYTFDDKLEWTKELNGVSKPGKNSYYSNMNADLLARIVEKVTGKNIIDVYKDYIFTPLNLKNTYIPENDKVYIPTIMHEGKIIKRVSLLNSSMGSGGIISTSRELMKFIKAFFNGWLFDEGLLRKLMDYSSIENGIPNTLYGGGLMKIKSKRNIIGHMGYTGAFAFADPDKKAFFVGYLAVDGVQQVLPKMLQEIFEKV